MEIFSKKQGYYFPSGMIFMSWIVTIAGTLALLQNPVAGLIMMLVGPIFTFVTTGIEINLTDKTYRDYITFYGLKTGKWLPLPEIEYISVYNAKYVQNVNSKVSGFKKEDEAVAVQFVMPGNRRMFITEFDKKHKAISTAAYFSTYLRLKILDATEQESTWIDMV